MTPDVANYADYYLRRLVHSLEKPYDPDAGGESGAGAPDRPPRRRRRRARRQASSRSCATRARRGAARQARPQARRRHRRQPQVRRRRSSTSTSCARCSTCSARDPRIDQRVRQYLLRPPAHRPCASRPSAALDPNTGEDRAFEIIAALGALMWTVDRAALVFCIDQVEDLRFFDDAEERFQKAVRDLIQIANRVPNAILIISCLDDFYGQVRGVLAQSYIDRIEKAGPVALLESRTPEEARLIIAKRLAHLAATGDSESGYSDPSAYFGPQFFEEFGGLSTRRLLEHAQNRLRDQDGARSRRARRGRRAEKGGFISTPGRGARPRLCAATATARRAAPASTTATPGSASRTPRKPKSRPTSASCSTSSPARSALAKEEWAGTIHAQRRAPRARRRPAPPSTSRCSTRAGSPTDGRIFLCNRPTQGGGFKRQLDRVLPQHGRQAAASCCGRATSRPTARTRRRRPSASSARAAAARSWCRSPSGSA